MVTVCWHCLDMTENDERFVAGALKELAQNLEKDPIKLPVSIKQLRDKSKLTEKVRERLNKLNDQSCEFSTCSAVIADTFVSEEGIAQRLLVYCSPDSNIAEAARRKESSAKYGANCGFFSAVYKPNSKVIVWHEALHLLGADDCYIVEDRRVRKKSCCKLDGCIMEYNPPESTCEKWPFLCDRNVKKLKEFAK